MSMQDKKRRSLGKGSSAGVGRILHDSMRGFCRDDVPTFYGQEPGTVVKGQESLFGVII
jgi:hypothetical protein